MIRSHVQSLVLAAAALPAAALAGSEPEPPPRAAAEIVAQVRAGDDAAGRRAAAQLRPQGWEDLVLALDAVSRDAEGARDAEARASLLVDALAGLAPEASRALYVASAGPHAGATLRLAALLAANRPRSAATLRQVVAIVAAGTLERSPTPTFARAGVTAIAAALVRRPLEVTAAADAWQPMARDGRAIVLDGISAAGAAGGGPALEAMLDACPGAPEAILVRLAAEPVRAPRRASHAIDTEVEIASNSDDLAVRFAALRLLARRDRPLCVERLAELLASPDAAVVCAAHAALREAVGAEIRADQGLWRVRIEAERRWFGRDAARDIRALDRGDAEARLAAMSRVAARRLYAPELVPHVARLCDGTEPEVRRAACVTLGRLGDADGIGALVRALDDRDAAVVCAASEALVLVTGLPAPSAPSGWRSVLVAAVR